MFPEWSFSIMKRIDPYFVLGVVTPLVLLGLYYSWQLLSENRPQTVPEEVTAGLEELRLAHKRGSAASPVRIVELSDYACPGCATIHEWASPVIDDYLDSEDVAYVVYDVILPIHDRGFIAAMYANCVEDQDEAAYWAFRSRLFETQKQWTQAVQPAHVLRELVDTTKVALSALESCVAKNDKRQERLHDAFGVMYDGGINYVPVLAVNGEIISGRSAKALRTALREEIESALREVR